MYPHLDTPFVQLVLLLKCTKIKENAGYLDGYAFFFFLLGLCWTQEGGSVIGYSSFKQPKLKKKKKKSICSTPIQKGRKGKLN